MCKISVVFNHPLEKKRQETSFFLLKRCNCVIFCPEISVCLCGTPCSLRAIAILFRMSITALFYHSLITTSNAKKHLVRGSVVVAIGFRTTIALPNI